MPEDLDDYVSGDPTSLIASATQRVRDYCRWHITPIRTETFDLFVSDHEWFVGHARPTQPPRLFVPTGHLVSVESIVHNGVAVDLDTIEFTDAGMIRWLPGYYGYSYNYQGAYTVTATHRCN